MKTEKEKMIERLPYQPWDKALVRDREVAKDITFAFNQIPPSQREKRKDLLSTLIKNKGDFHIETPFQCDYGYNIHVGEGFYANHNCIILDGAPVTIGDDVLLAPNVAIYTAGHPLHFQLRSEGIEYALPVRIGNHVWIGGNTVINPGVSIGNNVVIGSGSVIHKDVPDNVVVVGNPMRIVREITDEDYHYFYKNQKF